MNKETENILVKNSRLSVMYSIWMPIFGMCMIMSMMYFMFLKILFGAFWFGFAVYSKKQMDKLRRNITKEESKK